MGVANLNKEPLWKITWVANPFLCRTTKCGCDFKDQKPVLCSMHEEFFNNLIKEELWLARNQDKK